MGMDGLVTHAAAAALENPKRGQQRKAKQAYYVAPEHAASDPVSDGQVSPVAQSRSAAIGEREGGGGDSRPNAHAKAASIAPDLSDFEQLSRKVYALLEAMGTGSKTEAERDVVAGGHTAAGLQGRLRRPALPTANCR